MAPQNEMNEVTARFRLDKSYGPNDQEKIKHEIRNRLTTGSSDLVIKDVIDVKFESNDNIKGSSR